jgi:signal transduction histidine kinase
MSVDRSEEQGRVTGDALERARDDLYGMEQTLQDRPKEDSREQEALRKLLEVVEQINAEFGVERVLGLVASRIIEIFEAERVFIMEVSHEESIRFRLAVSFNGRTIPRPEDEVSHAVIHKVARNRQPILVTDAMSDPRFAEVSSVRSMKLHSVMVAPLLARGELLGVVYADNRVLSGAFSPWTLSLLSVFANHVGIALRNAQLFDELTTARAELALAERLKAIGQVAAFVAHEIKNPLGSIRIWSDALEEKWMEPEFRARFLEIVPREVARLDKAVQQILDYARPTPLIKVRLDLAKLMESVLRLYDPQIRQKRIQVSRDFQPGVPGVLADGERIREALVNLLRNSLDAMARRPTKELKVTVASLSQTEVGVTIEDTGAGIPETEIKRIFEPFRTSKESGSGIGLALCQKVVREHGGHITAENIPSGGARFRVSLPITGA